MTDLNDYIDPSNGWVLTRAKAISNNGLIVGYGLKDGVEHGFLFSLYAQSLPQAEQPPQITPLPEVTAPITIEPTPAPEPIPTNPSSNFPAIDSNAEPIEAEGSVSETGINYFVVKSITIWFDNTATIKFKSGSGNTIDVGEKVQVKADTNVDGSGTAIEIKVGG